MAKALKTYSVLIAWSDGDSEQGDYGETVRARDEEHAERIVRARMLREQWRETAGAGMSKREIADLHSVTTIHGDRYFGALLDCTPGAMWMADEMEKALRGLIAWRVANPPVEGDDVWPAAFKVIAEIDGL